MADTLRFLKNAWRGQSNGHPLVFICAFLLIVTPLPLWLGNVGLVLFLITAGIQFKKHQFIRRDYALLVSILLYMLMLISCFWSIDVSRTLNALPKEVALLILPIGFLIFPAFSKFDKNQIFKFYAYSMSLLAGFYLFRAIFRYSYTGNVSVFFYHELVTEEVNAIHVSVYFALAIAALISRKNKTRLDGLAISLLVVLLLLLSSKNILICCGVLTLVFVGKFSGLKKQRKLLLGMATVSILFIAILFIPAISKRFSIEAQTVWTANHSARNKTIQGFDIVTLQQAWSQEKFTHNDFFPGTAFRVYQFRIFIEMLLEDPILLKGYGLNASYKAIERKALEHNLYPGTREAKGYQNKNFHNQYVQNFADLGIFGLLLLLIMLTISLKNGIRDKDFLHISFTVLMISLFLTESFLWRQRGVMFFMTVYCVLNAGFSDVALKKNKLL